MSPFESRVFNTWTDKLIERIAKAYWNDCDEYEDLLDKYSYERPDLRNLLEDRVTNFRMFGIHDIE